MHKHSEKCPICKISGENEKFELSSSDKAELLRIQNKAKEAKKKQKEIALKTFELLKEVLEESGIKLSQGDSDFIFENKEFDVYVQFRDPSGEKWVDVSFNASIDENNLEDLPKKVLEKIKTHKKFEELEISEMKMRHNYKNYKNVKEGGRKELVEFLKRYFKEKNILGNEVGLGFAEVYIDQKQQGTRVIWIKEDDCLKGVERYLDRLNK